MKENSKFEDFSDWLMGLERASPQNFSMWNELIMYFNFLWRADPNQIIQEYLFDDQLLPLQRKTIIEFMIHPLKKRFRTFGTGLSKAFIVELFQHIEPRV